MKGLRSRSQRQYFGQQKQYEAGGVLQSLGKIGAGDRIRTGDVQLGKLAFCP